MSRPARRAAAILFFALLLLVWELSVRWFGGTAKAPHPLGIVEAAQRALGDGTLLIAIAGSLQRVMTGFGLAALFAIPLGLAMGTAEPLRRAFDPLVDGLRAIAPIAWIPMALLWLGIRGNAALFIVAYAAFFPIVLNTVQAVRLVDRKLIDAAQALGAGRWMLLRSVILPGAIPVTLTGARIAMAFAWGSIIAAEMAIGIKVNPGGGATVGLGQLMVNTLYIKRDINALVLYMVCIGFISLLIDQGMRGIQKAVTPWQR
jgi:ABC-type nitrate/sulfonate/bicarbonate transport system permease component